MGRKRVQLGDGRDAEIESRTARGESAETIARAVGGGLSVRTIARRQRELRGKGSPPVAPRPSPAPNFAREVTELTAPPPAAESEPESDDEIPLSPEAIESADAGTLDRLLKRAEKAGRVAEAEGNLAAIGQMGRLVVMVQEAKRKAAPLPKPDPNDAPDMVRLGAEVAARFHKLVDQVVDE